MTHTPHCQIALVSITKIIIENSGFIKSPVLAFPLVSLKIKKNLEPACMLSLEIILVTSQNNDMLYL